MNNEFIIITMNKIVLNIMHKENIPFIKLYKKTGFMNRQVIKLCEKLSLNNYNNLNEDLFKIKQKNIIIFDDIRNTRIINMIIEKNPGHRIIFWYWNPVKNSLHPNKVNKNIELWTYSSKDSHDYNMNLNTTFHSIKLFENINCDNVSNVGDIFFVGKNKGRKKNLIKIEKSFNDRGYSTHFHITRNRMWNINDKKPLSYEKVLELNSQYNFILDYYEDEYSGMSLRPLEALFMNKNIITNNIPIKNEYLFSTNIIHNINNNFHFNKIDKGQRDEMIKYYDIHSWLDRFN